MKRIFTEISAFAFIVAVLFSAGCLSDDLGRSDNGSGTGSTEPTIPDNSVIDAGMFSALNLDYPGLAAVKAYYDSDQYYLAAQALLEYYRGRTDVINGNVNLIAPSISAQEQEWADYALVKNEYRFYNGTYMDGRQTLFLPDVQQNRLGETCFGRSGRALQSASPSVDGCRRARPTVRRLTRPILPGG